VTTLSRRCPLVLLGACLGASAAAAAPPPFTIAEQGTWATLAKDEKGGYTAAWVSFALNEIFARRYGPGDRALTGALSVGAYDYSFPTVGIAASGNGTYRVAWDVIPKYYGGYLAERLLRPGDPPLGPLRNLGGYATPSLAPAGTGGSYAIAMLGAFASAGGPRSGVFVQLRGPDGRVRRQVNLGPGYAPHAAPAAEGGFWVVWTSPQGLRARRFSSAGEPLEVYLVDAASFPAAVAGNRHGELVVAWSDATGIFARWWNGRDRFGPRTSVAATPAAGIGRLSAAMDAEGKTLLVWGACCTAAHLEARRFERRGSPAGERFVLRESAALYPAVAAGAADDFVVAWDEAGGIRGQRLSWARPGDELCLFADGRWRCDDAHDGGRAESEFAFGGAQPAIPLLGDLDGEGRDDLCLLRGGRLLCDTAHDQGAAELKLVAALSADEIPLLGDLDGEGRDDLCRWRGGRLECDTAHDGGSAEVVVALDTGGDPLLADWDGDGDDDPCSAEAGSFTCDLDHDGQADSALELSSARPDETPLLGDLDGDGRADPCLYDGEHLRCDTRRDGDATFEISFPAGSAIPLLGNPDGI
jgi:hypothetical protein